MFYISDHFKLSVLATPFSLYSAFSSFDQFKIVSLSRDSCSFMMIIGNLFMSIPSPSFSYGWFVIFSVIISAIMWSMFHQGMSLLKELEKHHLKRKTSTNALRRRNQASASSLMMNTKSFIVGTMIRQIIFFLSFDRTEEI